MPGRLGLGANLSRDYPAKPLRRVAGFAAVENKTGANAMIATQDVKRAAPDGYTLLMTTLSHPVQDVVNAAKAKPGAITYASAGNGGSAHLASSTERRHPDCPSAPTMAESGFPGFVQYTQGLGVVAPAGTPTPLVGRLSEAVRASLAKSDTREKFKAPGAITEGGSTPEHFKNWLVAERTRWERVIQAAGAKAR